MMQRLAFSVDEFAALAGIGRTVAYREIREGRLRPLKVGRRTIISHDEAMRWLTALATATEPLAPSRTAKPQPAGAR